MTTAQLKENIDDNLIRLKRHYSVAIRGYDRPSLKDLANTLRIWMDMKKDVDQYLRLNRPNSRFNTHSLLPPFKKAFRGSQYIFAAFPRGIRILCQPDEHDEKRVIATILKSPPRHSGDEKPYSGMGMRSHLDRKSVSIFFLFSAFDYTGPRPLALGEKDSAYCIFKRVSFESWVATYPAINLRLPAEDGVLIEYAIPREDLIKRMANILGGSHPEGNKELFNKYDNSIRQLMEYTAGNLPLPYLILTKIAHDILQEFSSL